jgi:hypothetical protein
VRRKVYGHKRDKVIRKLWVLYNAVHHLSVHIVFLGYLNVGIAVMDLTCVVEPADDFVPRTST